MKEVEALRTAFAEMFSRGNRFSNPEFGLSGRICRAIGDTRVTAIRVRINRQTQPPACFLDILWDGETQGNDESSPSRNHLRRVIHQARLHFKSYKMHPEIFAQDCSQLESIISNRTIPDEREAIVELSGTIERTRNNYRSVMIRHDQQQINRECALEPSA